jgi:3-oxoacyl-[acyl-carrier protein] reductase
MLENKVILITGSSRGIGAATARLAKQYGATVILHGKTDSNELKRLSKEICSPYIYCDVTDEEAVKREVRSIGRVDILVNNAGINPSKTFIELTSNDWKEIIGVNLLGPVYFSRVVLPGMMERSYGKIINISSFKGHNYVSGKPAYAASKAAVMRITSSMAEEFAPYGINVNAVAPGFTETEMTTSTMSPKILSQINKIPLKRIAKPKEIAEAILFLASDKASYITGQTITVDGGLSII